MNQDTETIQLAKALIEKPSITPHDEGCQTLIAEKLKKLGFSIENLHFGPVQNLIAVLENGPPFFGFAGHTDVVPIGNLNDWLTPPFTPTIQNGFLFGRGAADMKGSLAAMITATERFLSQFPKPQGSIFFLITSDEEGDAEFGTQKMIEYLNEKNIRLNYCIVGEPTSHQKIGDVIKVGRRGSMTGRLKILGKQGHIAYPHLAENPIHRILDPLNKLVSRIWDQGHKDFPPTSFQISNINAGTGAGNVIPGILECLFNFRFSPEVSASMLQDEVHSILKEHELKYELEWKVFGNPFLTPSKGLILACEQAIQELQGYMPKASTDGGTSDARFIAHTDTEVIELGPCNATIHAINEHVSVDDLNQLSLIFENILTRLLLS